MGLDLTLRQLTNGTYYLSMPKGWVEGKGWEPGTEFELSEISKNEFKITKKND
jgi:hypothetical protein